MHLESVSSVYIQLTGQEKSARRPFKLPARASSKVEHTGYTAVQSALRLETYPELDLTGTR